MDLVWLGVAEIGLGLVFCFLGHSAARVVLALWGAVLGWALGQAASVALATSLPGWLLPVIGAVLLAWLSYAFYAVGVLALMGSIGWGLGVTFSRAFGWPSWVGTVLAIVIGLGLVILALRLNLPRMLLVVLTALIGAGAIIDGLQLLVGQPLDWLSSSAWQLQLVTYLAWTATFFALAVGGVIVQLRQGSTRTLREAYPR